MLSGQRKLLEKSAKHLVKAIHKKQKFTNAIRHLKKMSPKRQREIVWKSSNKFIKDFSDVLSKLRNHPEMVSAKHRKQLSQHQDKLRKLVNKKTPIAQKRAILAQDGTHAKRSMSLKSSGQKGGVFPLLIPVITALIGAGGAIAAGATTAAVAKA